MCEVKKIGLSLQPDCLGGGIGRHAGLKIPWTAMSVRVRFPSEAHHIPLGRNSERDFLLYSIVWHRSRQIHLDRLWAVLGVSGAQNQHFTLFSGYTLDVFCPKCCQGVWWINSSGKSPQKSG